MYPKVGYEKYGFWSIPKSFILQARLSVLHARLFSVQFQRSTNAEGSEEFGLKLVTDMPFDHWCGLPPQFDKWHDEITIVTSSKCYNLI